VVGTEFVVGFIRGDREGSRQTRLRGGFGMGTNSAVNRGSGADGAAGEVRKFSAKKQKGKQEKKKN